MARVSRVTRLVGFGSSIAALGAAGFAAVAQVEAPGRSAVSAPSDAALQAACTAQAVQKLASGLTAGRVTVAKIRNGPNLPDGVRFVPASPRLPAYCQVTGRFETNPATGRTANFLATFPSNWNGKYLQLGCSVHCGQFIVSDPASPALAAGYPGSPWDILRKGYAAFSTDEGHEGMSVGAWAIRGPGEVDEDAIEDWRYRANQVLARVGKAFTATFYGELRGSRQEVRRSYFSGCSGGGRDAMVAASYFPEEFDGIIAGSPYDPPGSNFQLAGIALASLRSQGSLVPAALISSIDPLVKAKCDAIDGVKDGLIQNPAACDFHPERDLPICTPGSPHGTCFTKEQVDTISAALTAITDEKGRTVQPGFAVGEIQPATFATPERPADLAAADPFPGSDNGGLAKGYWTLGDGFLKVIANRNDPGFFTRSLIRFSGPTASLPGLHMVVPAAAVARIAREQRMAIGQIPQNAGKLIAADRKLLIWQNLSDQTLTPYATINYYKRLSQLHGGYARLQRNVRLFGLPGTPHCGGGGVGPNTFDALTAMEDWVEEGRAPDALLGRRQPTSGPYKVKDTEQPALRTMPLCKFPEMARYRGRGDVNKAENWYCDATDKRMLIVGESGRRAGVIR